MIFFLLLLVGGAVLLLVPKKQQPVQAGVVSSVILAKPEPDRAPTEQEAIAAVYLFDRYLQSIGKSDIDRSTHRHESLLLLHGEEA